MRLTIKDLIHCSMFAALTAVGAFISIPVGPVPISLQSLFAMMSGAMLGSKKGFVSQLLYMIIGLIGIPVFAGGTGGLSSIMRPSFGFIFGFMAMAYIVGIMYENKFNIWGSALIASVVLYIIGLSYMTIILIIVGGNSFRLLEILNMGLFVFIPGDLLKVVITVLATSSISKHVSIPLLTD